MTRKEIFIGLSAALVAVFTIVSIISANLLMSAKSISQVSKAATIQDVGTNPTPNLKYFGYYFTDGLPVQSGKNYFKEITGTLGNSNVMHISAYTDPAVMTTFLQSAKETGVKLIINVYPILFDKNTSGQLGNGGRNCIQTGRQDGIALKMFSKDTANMYMLFYFDEPFWTGIGKTDFQLVTKTIRTDFPQVGVMVTEANIPFDPVYYGFAANQAVTSDYYQYVTDIGLDNYVYGRSAAGGWSKYLDLTSKLETIASQGQKIWLIPESFVLKSAAMGGTDAKILSDYLYLYYQQALLDTRIVGMLSFIYTWDSTNAAAGPDRYPARDLLLPSSRLYNKQFSEASITIGKNIIKNNPISPSTNSKPQGTVTGPTTGKIGQTLTYTATLTDTDGNLGAYGLAAAPGKRIISQTFVTPASAANFTKIGEKDIDSCDTATCTFTFNFTPTQAGKYYVIVNAFDSTGIFGNTQKCSGNIFNTPPANPTIYDWVRCNNTNQDYVTLTVN